jgi:hypothetical protein
MTTTATSLPVAAGRKLLTPEVGVAVAAFAALCVTVLLRSAQLLEPDDLAYRASIVALTHGHVTLTTPQYQALADQLGGIAQWVQLPSGSWLSEKNPGYPFFAAPFQLLGILRAAPLFYGALGCLGLYAGGRRWLGRWGGTFAVVLFCASGAALVFAWRPTMPTFTDASLVAASTGALLWTMLATDATTRRRTVAGLLAFLALEAAVSMRYTNALVLAVAIVAVPLARRSAELPWRSLAWWGSSLVALAAVVAAFDWHYYGAPLRTGYASGEITFSASAIWPNVQHMPYHLVRSMPFLLLGLAAVGWIAARWIGGRRGSRPTAERTGRRRDAAVGGALAACWIGIFGLYSAYTWTVGQSAMGSVVSVHLIRFYIPALGAVALLGAWLLVRLPRVVSFSALALLAGLAVLTFPSLASGGMPGGGPGGAFFGPGLRPGGGSGSSGGLPSGPPPAGAFRGGPPPAGMRPPPRGTAPPSAGQSGTQSFGSGA